MDVPKDTPDFAAEVMKACWSPLPDQRPTFSEILRRLDGMANVVLAHMQKYVYTK